MIIHACKDISRMDKVVGVGVCQCALEAKMPKAKQETTDIFIDMDLL